MQDELAQDLEQLDNLCLQKAKSRQRASLSPKKEADNFLDPSNNNANETAEIAHSFSAKKKHSKRQKDKNRTIRHKKEINLNPKLCLPTETEHFDQNYDSQINKVVIQVKNIDGNSEEDLAKELGSFSKIKNKIQGSCQSDMSSSQCNPETVSSQASISRGKPPIQHQVKSMTLKEAFGTGTNSSQTTATKKTEGKVVSQTGFQMKPNLVISGQKSLIQAPSQSSLDKLKRGASSSALRPTNSSSSLTIVTPSSVNAQKVVVKYKDKDSRATNTRNDMLLKRAQIHSQLLVHDSLQSSGLSKELGGGNILNTIPHIVADLTLNNSTVIVKESARTTSKRSPMKARESIVSATQMTTSQKKHKRMHVRSNRKSMVVNSCADNTKPPSHRLTKIPSIHSKSGINQGENSRAKVFSHISKTHQASKESDHGFQSVRVKLDRDSVARKPSVGSQDANNLNGLIQLRPMTVPAYQKRLSVPMQFNSQRQFNEDGQDLDAQTNAEQQQQCMQTQPSQRSTYSNQISVQISSQRQNEALSSVYHSTVIIDTTAKKTEQSSNHYNQLQQKKFYNTIEPPQVAIESPKPHKRTSITTLTDHTLNCPSTATRPKQEQQDSSDNQMIIQQQQHTQAQQRSSNSLNQNTNMPQVPAIVSSSGIDVGNFSKQVAAVKQEDYFVLDNNNRVILVSSTQHPNTAAPLPSANYMAQANQRASCIQKPKSITRAGTENMARTQNQWQQPQPLRSHQQPSSYQQTSAQQKIVEQLSGKQGIKRKTSSSNVGTALKENSEQQYLMMEGGFSNHIHDQQQQMYAGYSRHELHSQKANRNSNQNMKTAGLGVSRFGQMPPNFSTTTSTYQSIVTGSQPAPPQGLVYQLNQNGAYIVSQISGSGQLAPATIQQQSPTLAPNMSAQQRQHQQVLQNGQRINASPQQQVYYTSQQQQLQANFQQQQNMQMQLQQQQQMAAPNAVQLSYQTSQQSAGANQQKQVQNSQSRTRPRSSAPTPSLTQVKKRVQSSINGGGVVCRDSVPRAHPSVTNGLQVEIDGRQLTNENLMQTAGHIIVTTNQGGTPINELYQPMIMNQNTVHNLHNPSLTPQVIQGIGGHKSLQATGVIGPDALVQQLTGGQNGTGRTRSKRRDGSTSHSATEKGFFGKRKNRDRDSKLGVNQQPTAPVHKSSTQKASTLNQQSAGNQATISVPQGYLIRDSYQSSQHSGSANRPQTSKQQQQLSFHKTTASITNKINGSIINQQVNLTGESDSESTRGGQLISESQIANSIVRGVFVNSRSSMQGSSRLVSETSNAVHQSGFNNFQQRNLSSVRSGQLVNFTNSMSSDQEISNTNSKDQLALHKQLSNSDRAKILNQSASPSTKISIRGRKGINSIVGSGITPSGQTSTGLQMMPSTPKTYKRTKRLLFARRMNLMDRPVLIVTFQGVLGDFMKKSVIPGLKETPVSNQITTQATQPAKEKKPVQKEEEVFNLRQGVVEGLRYLSQLFQLIIFSRETVEDSWYQSKGGQCPAIEVQTKAILSWLQSTPEIKLDGFYASCLPAKQQTMTDDYSQIFIDFGLNSEQKVKEKVLFINSISNDFICNQRLPATGNISPKGKKPNPVQLGISNARGLTDIDSRGYFMFDLSCQPAEPLVKGLPISIDLKQQKTNRLEGARSSSIIVDQQQEDKNSTCGGDRGEPELKTRHMPATLLVPNLRTQNAKMQTNFQHIIKTVMILAFMGQKQSAAKHLIKDNSVRDFATDLYELETDFGIIREKQIKLTQKRLYIMPQQSRGQNDLLTGGANSIQQNLNNSHKAASLQRRIRQANSNSNAGSVLHPQRETESPSSDVSGRNGNSGRYIQSRGVGRQQTAKMQTNTSSRTTAATHIGHENTTSSTHSNQAHQQLGKGRSQSINSEKGQTDQQMTQNESSINMGQMDHSPRDIDGTIMNYPGQRELSIDLTDGAFFANLSWSIAIDYLNNKPLNQQKRFLGMQSGCSDVIWRFYKKQATERVQLRKIYETKMKDAEHLIKHTLANETIVANQQLSMDQIFEILRSRDLVGNPFGFTMGRNYRFFANLKVQMRRKLSSELDQWKARNQAAASLKKPKEAAATQSSKEVATCKDVKSQQDATDMTVEDKELKEAERLNSIIQSQQVLQQQQYEAIEELLEKNQLMNRFVVVGLDAPFIK